MFKCIEENEDSAVGQDKNPTIRIVPVCLHHRIFADVKRWRGHRQMAGRGQTYYQEIMVCKDVCLIPS